MRYVVPGVIRRTYGARRWMLARRALGPTRRPKLLELAAELLSSRSPVAADVVAQILNVTLQIELVLLQPADVEFLPRGAALELSGNVLFVITDDPVSVRLVLLIQPQKDGETGRKHTW